VAQPYVVGYVVGFVAGATARFAATGLGAEEDFPAPARSALASGEL
jgi:hypothetical protein